MKLVSGLSVFTFLFASYFFASQKVTFTNATSIIDEKKGCPCIGTAFVLEMINLNPKTGNQEFEKSLWQFQQTQW
jgi:hypothetical protein